MAKSDFLNILYNTKISWETQFRVVDETGVDETGINKKKLMGMTPQYFHTIPTSCAILPPICLVFICGHRRVVESSGVAG